MAYQFQPIGPATTQEGSGVVIPQLQAAPKLQTGTPQQIREAERGGLKGLARGLLAGPLSKLVMNQLVSRIPGVGSNLYEDPYTGEPVSARDDKTKHPTAPDRTLNTEGLTDPVAQSLKDAETRVRALYGDRIKRPKQLSDKGQAVQAVISSLFGLGLDDEELEAYTSGVQYGFKQQANREEKQATRFLSQQQQINEKILSSVPEWETKRFYATHIPLTDKQRAEIDKNVPMDQRPAYSGVDPYGIDRNGMRNTLTGEVWYQSLGKDADRDNDNNLIKAGEWYQNSLRTSRAEEGSRAVPQRVKVYNKKTADTGDDRDGQWFYEDRNGDGTPEPVLKLLEPHEDGVLKWIAIQDLDPNNPKNFMPDGTSAWIADDNERYTERARARRLTATGENLWLDALTANDDAWRNMVYIANQLEDIDPAAFAQRTGRFGNFLNDMQVEVLNLSNMFGGGDTGYVRANEWQTQNFSGRDARAATTLSAANLAFLRNPNDATRNAFLTALTEFRDEVRDKSGGAHKGETLTWLDSLNDDYLRDLSTGRAVVLSSQIQLGYLSATLFGQSGKNLSDNDFAYNLQLMGFGETSDAQVVKDNLSNYLARRLFEADRANEPSSYLNVDAETKRIRNNALFQGTYLISPDDLAALAIPRPTGANGAALPDTDPAVVDWKNNQIALRTKVTQQADRYSAGHGFHKVWGFDPNAFGPGIGGFVMRSAMDRMGVSDKNSIEESDNVIRRFTDPGGIFDVRVKRIFGQDYDWRTQSGAGKALPTVREQGSSLGTQRSITDQVNNP